jgi:protein-S-isoprenylcysteine O-methyltransferase Ste14
MPAKKVIQTQPLNPSFKPSPALEMYFDIFDYLSTSLPPGQKTIPMRYPVNL